MSQYMRKPGYMKRAVIAWCILNGILLFTLAAFVFILGDYMDRWYVMIPMLIGVVISEWIIMGETIAPIIKDWIKQEELVEDGQKPSWQK